MRIRHAARTWLALSYLAALFSVGAPDLAFAEAAKGTSKPSAAKPTSSGKRGTKRATAKGAAKPKKGGGKHSKAIPRKPGSEPGEPDEAIRRIIAGTASRTVRESEELRAMRELDMALFPSMAPTSGQPWLAEGTPLIDLGAPQLEASGMPPSPLLTPPPVAEKKADLSWLRKLNMPDIPVRWDARVIRYLEYYKNTSRGRSMVATWIRKSGRYSGAIRRVLREQGLPEDLLWLALVESGFNPTIRSPVGAAGLWQFMPEGARIYGLTVDRWVDERLDPERSTLAAARYLADLHQRFGTWELAFAAYNMGYGGLLASIRKYNTNDFWELSRLESGMPYETALYVPKIVAMAIVSRNKAIFGCNDVELDSAINFDKVAIGAGVSLRSVALAAGAPFSSVESLNPQLLANRAPPLDPGAKKERSFTVRVPPGTGARVAKGLSKLIEQEGKLQRYRVRWGETLDDIAATRGVNRSTIMSLNGLQRHEVLRPGTVIFVPAAPGTGTAVAANVIAEAPANKPVVVVPDRSFSYPKRRRVFYRVVSGDSMRDIARIFGVKPDEIGMWNMLEPSARLHEGMTLQVYVPKGYDAERVLALDEANASVITAGSPDFFAHFEGQRGRTRLELVAKDGDNWRAIAKRHGLTIGQVERINQRSRSSALSPGDKYVVYVPIERASDKASVDEKAEGPTVVASADADAEAKPAEEKGTTPAVYRKVLETDDDKSDEKAAENKPGHELPPSNDKAAEQKDEKAAEKKADEKPAATAEVKKTDEKKADEKPAATAENDKIEKKVEEKKAEAKPAEPKDADKAGGKDKVVQPTDKGAAAKTL